MSIKSLLSNLRGKVGRFIKVMKKRWLSIIVGMLLTWAFLVIRISLAENLVYVSDDIYILACEMVTESGPGPRLKEAAKRHKENLEECKTYLRQRTSANTVQKIVASAGGFPGAGWLFGDWDEYRAEKGIDEAMKILGQIREETDQRKILEAIWEAGEHLLKFREKMISFRRVGRIKIGFYKNERISQELQKAVETAIGISQIELDSFEADKSWERAWALCEANRKSVLLLFLARSRYQEDKIAEHLENFKKTVEKETVATKQSFF